MEHAFFLLSMGGVIGGSWAWFRAQNQVPDCPKCSIETEQRRTIVEISSIARAGEARMRHVAGTADKGSTTNEFNGSQG